MCERRRWRAAFILAIAMVWLLACQIPAAAQGWSNGYKYRRTITVDHTKVPNTDQTNFPLLISGTYSYLASTANGGNVTNTNGYDIIFTSDASGTNPLVYERQTYNPSTGQLGCWVSIPTLSHTTDTVLYMFYGNSAVTTDQSNGIGVWDSNYKGVWHFNQTPNGSGSEKDSTSNGYNGTPASSGIALSSDGIAGGSLQFDGQSSSNNVVLSSALPGGAPLTASIWIKTGGLNSNAQSNVITKSQWPSTGWSMGDNGQYDANIFFRTMPNWTSLVDIPRSSVNNDVWHCLVGTIDTSNNIRFYLDGTLKGTAVPSSISADTTDPISVGGFAGSVQGGLLTEVRISNSVRTADWIATEFNNGSSPSTFYSFGPSIVVGQWLDQDIGSVGIGGGATYANGAFTIAGSGQGAFSTTADGTNFVSQALSGDGSIVARIVSLSGTNAEAGVMIRETLNADAANVYTGFNPSYIFMSQRASTGTTSSQQFPVGSISLPYWVKIIRSGNAFTAYCSPDGVNWSQVGSTQTVVMAQDVYIGLAVSSANNSAIVRATFDNVSISSTTAPAPAIISVSATTGSIGSQVWITGSGFGDSQNGSIVTVNGTVVTINSWTATTISFTIPSGATSGPLLVSVAPSMNDSNAVEFTVTSQPLPSGWLDEDIGIVGMTGSAGYANGTFTVSGAGKGTFSTSTDALHFVYQGLSGDGMIVARVASLPGTSAQAGIMIRETLNPAATNAQAIYNAEYTFMLERTSTGASSSSQAGVFYVTPPYWVKLVRSGSTFTSYSSPDGFNWTQAGSSQTINMAQQVYIGLGVSSQSTSALATATFDNVSISTASVPAPIITGVSATTGSIGNQVTITGSGFGATQAGSVVLLNGSLVTINNWSSTSIIFTIPTGATSGPLLISVAPTMNDSNYVSFTVTSQPLPIPWLDQDIGSVGLTGSATFANATFTVTGAGGGTTSSVADGIHFVYQPLSGDGAIVARVNIASGTSNTQAGVMIRESLAAAAANMFIAGYTTNSIVLFDRATTATGTSEQTFIDVALPYWIKMLRSGSTFLAYTSPDGVNWTQLGSSQTISMAQNVYAGLVVSSGSTTTRSTATFVNVNFINGSVPIISALSPSLGGIGSSVTITGSNFGATQGNNSTVSFNGIQTSSITSWSDTQIIASVPIGATSGLVSVVVNSIPSTSTGGFIVINPVITGVLPPSAPVGGSVTLSGSGFGPSESSGGRVVFNGTAGTVSSWSDTSVAVNVPSGATSGPVVLSNDGISSGSVQFTVLEPLSVTAISPSAGSIGSTVAITGTGFGSIQSNSTAAVNGINATITGWSDTLITAIVPSGATTGPVSVTVASDTVLGPFFDINTTVQLTDSLGNTSSYTGVMIGGTWYTSDAQGSGCSSCTQRGVVHNTYDNAGHMLSSTDELGHTTSYTYDTNGNRTSVSKPIGGGLNATTSYTYNNFGEVLTATDPLGNVTTNAYDAHGNLLTVTSPAPNSNTATSVTQFAYDGKGELTQITDPLNNVTQITYTLAGLIATIKDAQNNVTTYAYDTHGNRTSVTDALQHQTTFAYDTGDRLKTITYPDSTTATFTYDSRGRRTSATDQNGKTTAYVYDDADRLTSVTDAANNVTTYAYDTEDNLISITDANLHATSFSHDAFGRVTKTTFPSTNIETYGYDAVGNLTSKTDRKNQQITYTYDQLNRLTQKSYPDSSSVNYTYDNDSRLTQVTDSTGTYQFTFDNMGRLTNTTTSYAFLSGRNFTTAYGYDAASNRTSFTDPESGATAYVYDTLNRLQTLTPPAAYGGGSFGFAYDALSRRTSLTRPNAVNTAYGYDNLSRLLSVAHDKGGTTLDGASYTVDNAGNRTSRTPLPASTATNYTYDAIYELLSAQQGTTTTESYTYDPVGNRLSSLGVSSYTINSSNELTAKTDVTYTYDSNGNTLTKVDSTGTTTYNWDFENRLTSVTLPGTGGTVSFKYDPSGRRIYKSSTAGTSVYAYDGDNLIEETNASGGVVARYSQTTEIDEPLAMLRGGTTSYYEQDGLDSVTSLSNGAGALAQTYTFDSFGKQTASSGSLVNPFQYTARELDSETDLYFYRARYYDFAVGRFLSEDPLAFDTGLNFYNYVNGNPTNLADPFGLYTYKPPKPGKPPIPPASPKLDKFLKCLETCIQGSPTTITVTATTPLPGEPHADPGHAAGTTVDIKPVDMSKSWFWCCAGKCGGAFGLDEGPGGLKFPTTQGFNYHIQLVPPRHPSPKAPNSIPQTPDCKPGCSRDSR